MTVSVKRDPCPAARAFSACSLVAYLFIKSKECRYLLTSKYDTWIVFFGSFDSMLQRGGLGSFVTTGYIFLVKGYQIVRTSYS